jgi:hypothetical protein
MKSTPESPGSVDCGLSIVSFTQRTFCAFAVGGTMFSRARSSIVKLPCLATWKFTPSDDVSIL